MRIGFIGLGNVGSKLAGSLLRNGVDLVVRDVDTALMEGFAERGADTAPSARALAEQCQIVITCLPSPAICAEVMEADDGVLAGLAPGDIWLEMSTTDEAEVRRLGALVAAKGAVPIDCPVSGGCHRAATGNISIFAGGDRAAFEHVLPILTMMGRRILHTGELGSASVLKVVTNYLASINLVAIGEAFAVAAQAGIGHDHDLRGDPHLVGQLVRTRDRRTGDPQRLLRHQLHDGSRPEGHGLVSRGRLAGAASISTSDLWCSTSSTRRPSATARVPCLPGWCSDSKTRWARAFGRRGSRPR